MSLFSRRGVLSLVIPGTAVAIEPRKPKYTFCQDLALFVHQLNQFIEKLNRGQFDYKMLQKCRELWRRVEE